MSEEQKSNFDQENLNQINHRKRQASLECHGTTNLAKTKT